MHSDSYNDTHIDADNDTHIETDVIHLLVIF